jgi:hypothetical protein
VPPFLGAFALQLDSQLDWRAVVFAAIVALAATILCGLFPAWRTSRGRSLVAFKGEIGSGTPRRRPLGLVAQVVMSLVLLFVAGSCLQALHRVYATDPGFEVAGRLYAYTSVSSPPFTPESRAVLHAGVGATARAASRAGGLPHIDLAAHADGFELRVASSIWSQVVTSRSATSRETPGQ